MKVSVIVSTRNRPHKIGNCLKSILANSFSDFEVIVVDQSDNEETKEIVKKISTSLFRYFKRNERGLSKARNFGIKKAQGKIIAFTDDDCLVSQDWLRNIESFLRRHEAVVGVFGKSLPFNPKKHLNLICPSTFNPGNRLKIFNCPAIAYYKYWGPGNNMSFRKSLFNEITPFKEWLGVGSIGMASEETELTYRILKKNYKLAFVPNVIVYHNRWLNYHQKQILEGKYTGGLIAFHCYFFFKKEKDMAKFIVRRIKERIIVKLKNLFADTKRLDIVGFYRHKKEPFFIIWEIVCILKGLIIAIYFTFIKQKNNTTFNAIDENRPSF